MNPYIKTITDDLVFEFYEHNFTKADELIGKVFNHLTDITSEKDKLDLITFILEINETKKTEHINTCLEINCGKEKKFIKVNYFLQQELEQLGVLATDNFTWEEKSKCNDKLDEILQTIKNSNELIYENLEILSNEIKELKNLYVLGKKNWKQQFAGKMNDMVLSGVISELTAKPLIENVLKPGVDIVTSIMLGV